ncbi:MAG: GAF and ANTAR domain-containing protein [Gordonia paraffinivorans]
MSDDDHLDDGLGHSVFATLARTLHDTATTSPDSGADAVAADITRSATAVLPPVDHASLTLATRWSEGLPVLRSVAATSAVATRFDEMQRRHGDGPSMDVVRRHRTVAIDDIRTEPRRSDLLDEARDVLPIRSVLCVHLHTGADEMGALNLYADTADALRDIAGGADTLAAHAAIALSVARHRDEFLSVLASRDVIGQATGVLMERLSIDAGEARRLLRRRSQEDGMPLREVAARVTATARPPRDG